MRALVVGFTAVALVTCATESIPEGLRLKNPSFIDAAATALYPWADPDSFERINDEAVRFAISGRIDTEFRRISGKPCAVQTVSIATGKASTQFDFGRLSRDYINVPGDGFMGGKIRLLGDNIFCLRIAGEASCYNMHDISVGGINGARKVLRAMEFIHKNYCPPKD